MKMATGSATSPATAWRNSAADNAVVRNGASVRTIGAIAACIPPAPGIPSAGPSSRQPARRPTRMSSPSGVNPSPLPSSPHMAWRTAAASLLCNASLKPPSSTQANRCRASLQREISVRPDTDSSAGRGSHQRTMLTRRFPTSNPPSPTRQRSPADERTLSAGLVSATPLGSRMASPLAKTSTWPRACNHAALEDIPSRTPGWRGPSMMWRTPRLAAAGQEAGGAFTPTWCSRTGTGSAQPRSTIAATGPPRKAPDGWRQPRRRPPHRRLRLPPLPRRPL